MGLDSSIKISEDDSFFMLGGHSLEQMMMENRSSQVLGVKITQTQVMAAPFMGDLVRLLELLNTRPSMTLPTFSYTPRNISTRCLSSPNLSTSSFVAT